jgi:hypothetical protein
MHNLSPTTKYKIVTIQVAAKANLSDAEITDGLNEMLRPVCATEEGLVDDWQFVSTDHGPSDYEIRISSEAPEEGELFK